MIKQPESGRPAPGQIDVWYRLTESLDAPDVIAARARLSREERTRCDQYRFGCDRRDYVVSHALLRTSLSRYLDVDPKMWTFDAGVHGKPYLTAAAQSGRTLTFNLSHTRGMVACAIASDVPVGIDVVRTDTTFDYPLVASSSFSADELAQLESCRQEEDRAAHFMEVWALKEAYTKATGQGLSADLSGFGFVIDSHVIRFLSPRGVDPHAWQFALFALEPHYRIAVAAECGRTTVPTIEARAAESGFGRTATVGAASSSAWKS